MTPKERAQRGIRSMIQKRGGNYKDISRGFALFDQYEKEMLNMHQSKEGSSQKTENKAR